MESSELFCHVDNDEDDQGDEEQADAARLFSIWCNRDEASWRWEEEEEISLACDKGGEVQKKRGGERRTSCDGEGSVQLLQRSRETV